MDGPKDLEFYLKDFSDIKFPVKIRGYRDVKTEILHIRNYLNSFDSEYLKFLEQFSLQHPPMASSVRMVALVPARFEENRISRFLKAFDSENRRISNVEPPIIELIILNNWRSGESPDSTCEVISDHLKRRNSSYPVLYIEHEWASAYIYHAVALARKLLSDYALYRASQRRSCPGPLYLLTEDADVEEIDLNRTLSMLNYLDNYPQFDALRGVQERTRSALAINNLLLFERRSWYYTECQLSSQKYWPCNWENANFYWNRVVTGGWNTCFTAEIYALIRGYTPTVRIFEDMDIGQRISVIRGGWNSERFVPNVSTIKRVPYRAVSNAGRAILSLIQAKHIYEDSMDFKSFFDRAAEDALRQTDVMDLLEKISEFAEIGENNLCRFNKLCTELLTEIVRIFGCEEKAMKVFNRSMFFMGFKKEDFELSQEGHVGIINYSRFKQFADHLRNRLS